MSKLKPYRRELSKKVRSLRKEAKWSQSELARRAGIAASAVSMIESGQRAPSLIVSRKISDALKVPLSELTGESPKGKSPKERIDKKAHAFFREFGELEDLSASERKIILEIAKEFKGKK